MKKLVFLFTVLLFANSLLFSQNSIQLKFLAKDINTNSPIDIDSIKIINRTQSKQLVVYQSEVSLGTCQANSIYTLFEDNFSSKVYPNPFRDYQYIELSSNKNDFYLINVFDIKGAIACSFKEQLGLGNYRLKFTNSRAGIYFITVQNSNFMTSHRVVCEKGNSGKSEIILENNDVLNQNIPLLKNATSNNFCISTGDGIECISFCGSCTDTVKLNVTQNSNNLNFEYKGFYPTINTLITSNLSYTKASFSAQITNSGCEKFKSVGVCLATTAEPTVKNKAYYQQVVKDQINLDISDLESGTTYYARAFIENDKGIVYGQNINFNTCNYPIVKTLNADNIKYTSFRSGAQISGLDCAGYTSKGICWSKSQTPTIADKIIYNEGNNETFYADLKGLKSGENYYVRAFAISNNQTFYGETKIFKTIGYPVVSTTNPDSVKVYSAKLGGTITAETGSEISFTGVCWSKQQNPTTSNFINVFGNSPGNFTKVVDKIEPFTTYYARAYVQIGDSVIYGNQVSFTSLEVLDIINFKADTVTNHLASLNYQINKNTDVNILSNGICYSKTAVPDLSGNKVTKAYQLLSHYNDTIFPLYSNSQYHVRPYAITDKDTIFGNDLIISTKKTTNSLADLGMITGAIYDSLANKIYLIGDGKHTDCSPTMQQIAVALDWAYADKDYYNYISIDPLSESVNEAWMKTRINGEAEDTDFGWIMFEADRLMKNYGLGRDNITKAKIYSNIPHYKNTFELMDSIAANTNPDIWSRFWLYPKVSKADASKDGIIIKEAKIGVQTQAMKWDEVKDSLVPAPGEVDNVSIAFANFMTDKYDEFAKERPVFRKLEQNLRLLMIAEWVRENNIPVNLDWINTESDNTYFVPRFTSSLTVTDKKLEGNQTLTRTLFGGTSMDVDYTFTNSVDNINTAKHNIENPTINEGILGSYFDANNNPLTSIECSEGNPYIITGLGNLCGEKSRNKSGGCAYCAIGAYQYSTLQIQNLGEKKLYPMISKLNTYTARPVSGSGSYYVYDIDGAEIEIKDLSLLIDGEKTIHFSEENYSAFDGDNFATVTADDPQESWYLESIGTGTAKYYWAANDPLSNRQIIFGSDFENCLSDTKDGVTLNYTSYTDGRVKRIDNVQNSEYVEFLFGSNSSRYIGYTNQSGAKHYFDPADAPAGTALNIPIQIDGKGSCSIQLNKNSFDWTFTSNPQTFGASEISFLDQHITGIRQAVAKPEMTPFFDGGRSIFVSNSGIIKLEVPFEDLDNKSKMFLPENTPVKGIERVEDGKLLIYQQTANNKLLHEYSDRQTYNTYEGTAAITKNFENEALRVSNESTSNKIYATASVIDGIFSAQIGKNRLSIPVSDINLPENKQKIATAFNGYTEVTIKRVFTDQMYEQISAGTQADPFNQYQLYKNYCPKINISSDYLIAEKHQSRYQNQTVKNAGSIAVWADPSFMDHSVNNNIQASFTSAGINLDADIASLGNSDIIIINSELNAAAKESLNKNADWLKKKIVVFNNCVNSQSNLSDNSKLIQDYDLTAIIGYQPAQSATAISAVLNKLAPMVSGLQSPVSFIDLWKQAIEAAKLDPANSTIIEALNDLKNCYVQHS